MTPWRICCHISRRRWTYGDSGRPAGRGAGGTSKGWDSSPPCWLKPSPKPSHPPHRPVRWRALAPASGRRCGCGHRRARGAGVRRCPAGWPRQCAPPAVAAGRTRGPPPQVPGRGWRSQASRICIDLGLPQPRGPVEEERALVGQANDLLLASAPISAPASQGALACSSIKDCRATRASRHRSAHRSSLRLIRASRRTRRRSFPVVASGREGKYQPRNTSSRNPAFTRRCRSILGRSVPRMTCLPAFCRPASKVSDFARRVWGEPWLGLTFPSH